jgi:hypothetical protein
VRVRTLRYADVAQEPVPASAGPTTSAVQMPLQSGPSFWRAVAFSVTVSVMSNLLIEALFRRGRR